MTTRFLRPPHVSPAELDAALEGGWYRVGQALMTCRFLNFRGALRSVTWTRLPLASWSPSRSNRRVLARNGRRFRVTEGPLVLDDLREDLYRRYQEVAPGKAASLRVFLLGDSSEDAWPTTRELLLWDGDRLVAGSWFDVGERAVQSLLGAYDPAFARWGLGYHTLLLEALWAKERGFSHHYAGYVVEGDEAMDYKLRVGAVEHLDDATRAWLPWSQRREEGLPHRRVGAALERVRDALRRRGAEASVREHAHFDLPGLDPRAGATLRHPWFLDTGKVHAAALGRPVVVFDLDSNRWHLLVGWPVEATLHAPGEPDRAIVVWATGGQRATSDDPEVVAGAALQWRQRLAAGKAP